MTPAQLAAFNVWREADLGSTTSLQNAQDAFAAGWEARGEEMVPRAMDTMPDEFRDGRDVLIFIPEKDPFRARWVAASYVDYSGSWYIGAYDKAANDEVAFWLPLPTEPQEVPK